MRRTLLLVLALTACGTPQEQCVYGATRDLRVLDRLINETQTNINRGYALEQVTQYRRVWVNCTGRPVGGKPARPQMCWETEPFSVARPQAIDLADEQRKLDSMLAKRRDQERAASGAIAQCKALHPE